jgi:hypothetical protein
VLSVLLQSQFPYTDHFGCLDGKSEKIVKLPTHLVKCSLPNSNVPCIAQLRIYKAFQLRIRDSRL